MKFKKILSFLVAAMVLFGSICASAAEAEFSILKGRKNVNVEHLIKLLKSDALFSDLDLDDDEGLEEFEYMLDSATQVYSVFDKKKNNQIGFVYAQVQGNFCVYLTHLVIHSQYRRRKIGSKLIEFVLNDKDLGCNFFFCLPADKNAEEFFEKLGFERSKDGTEAYEYIR